MLSTRSWEREEAVKKVLIIIKGGAVHGIRKPKGVELEIRDYDIEGSGLEEDNDAFQQDKDGAWFHKMFWGVDAVEW